MKFNKITRGANRAANNEDSIYAILDVGFLCHVAFMHEDVPMIIPTAYGRKGDILYLHGSAKNFMLNQIIQQKTICISVTHLDGVVLARTLFDTSANYRSVVLFGKASLVEKEGERLEALKIITDNIIPGRWEEVPVGSESELKATMVVAFKTERASAKIRSGGPAGDENQENEVWSGHIPLGLQALEPIADPKFGGNLPMTKSVKDFWPKKA